MRTRKTGLLIEILLSILIFSIACAVVLQIFVASKQDSVDTLEQTQAANCAQSLAEIFRANPVEPALLSAFYAQEIDSADHTYTLWFDQDMLPCESSAATYSAKIIVEEKQSSAGTLYCADITIWKNDEQLYALQAEKYLHNEVPS